VICKPLFLFFCVKNTHLNLLVIFGCRTYDFWQVLCIVFAVNKKLYDLLSGY